MSLEESIRTMLKEVVREVLQEELYARQNETEFLGDYPDMLTTTHVKEILHIKQSKMSELMNRSDFPTFKLAGTRVPKHKFILWIENNTRWIEENS